MTKELRTLTIFALMNDIYISTRKGDRSVVGVQICKKYKIGATILHILSTMKLIEARQKGGTIWVAVAYPTPKLAEEAYEAELKYFALKNEAKKVSDNDQDRIGYILNQLKLIDNRLKEVESILIVKKVNDEHSY